MNSDLEIARELAVDAGTILLRHYARPSGVDWKGEGNPVTEADRAASRFLVAEIGKRRPEDAIVSEEARDDPARLSRKRVWLVDPMDGTAEFISGCDEFAVMIGLSVDGASRVGVVYQPSTRKLYYAAAGDGAFLDDGETTRRLEVSTESEPDRMRVAVSRSHHSKAVEHLSNVMGFREAVPCGSLGLKVGLICEGRAHLYVTTSRRTYQWDTCAPDILLREAGGRMTDCTGAPFRYNRAELRNIDGVIASNGPIHGRIALAIGSSKSA